MENMDIGLQVTLVLGSAVGTATQKQPKITCSQMIPRNTVRESGDQIIMRSLSKSDCPVPAVRTPDNPSHLLGKRNVASEISVTDKSGRKI
jgi:hypothetical protein